VQTHELFSRLCTITNALEHCIAALPEVYAADAAPGQVLRAALDAVRLSLDQLIDDLLESVGADQEQPGAGTEEEPSL
jgi:hypothetical protein